MNAFIPFHPLGFIAAKLAAMHEEKDSRTTRQQNVILELSSSLSEDVLVSFLESTHAIKKIVEMGLPTKQLLLSSEIEYSKLEDKEILKVHYYCTTSECVWIDVAIIYKLVNGIPDRHAKATFTTQLVESNYHSVRSVEIEDYTEISQSEASELLNVVETDSKLATLYTITHPKAILAARDTITVLESVLYNMFVYNMFDLFQVNYKDQQDD